MADGPSSDPRAVPKLLKLSLPHPSTGERIATLCGKMTARPDETGVEILEKGDLFFFYRPKVDKEEAHGVEDVQRLYLILRPYTGEEMNIPSEEEHSAGEEMGRKSAEEQTSGGGGRRLLKLLVLGRKSLPDTQPKKKSPHWGFVEMVTSNVENVKKALRGAEYDTSTRGHRKVQDSRPVGEGLYWILKHNPGGKKMHTHLVYKLEYPTGDELGDPQEAFHIEREGSFIVQIKNPEQHGGWSGKKKKASFPTYLQGLFGNRGYHPADPPEFLSYEGCEFLLISASDDPEHELGIELKTEEGQQEECSDLKRAFDFGPTRPLFHGTWV